MGEFSFPRLIAAVKRWPLAIASWINDPRLDRLRHLAKTQSLTVGQLFMSTCNDRMAVMDSGHWLAIQRVKTNERSFDRWRCRNGGPVRSVYISWLNSPTIKTLSTVGQPTRGHDAAVGRTF